MKSKIGLAFSILAIVGAFAYFRINSSTSSDSNLVVVASSNNSISSLGKAGEVAETVEKKLELLGEQRAQTMKVVEGNIEDTYAKEEQVVMDSSHPGYEVEDGVAVVEGDLVLGEPREGQKYTGFSQSIVTWPGATVPFFIQGDLENKERVIQAIAAFANTGINFVPYSGQSDALVFQNGTGNCKSYVGKIGGMQPLWVSPGCGTKELIHEIMHALGFIHEQNRSDRETFIEVLWPHVAETAKVNFEKFSTDMMTVSGLGSFDYQSAMIYPVFMFSKGGQQTMRSKSSGMEIMPSSTLSIGDILRLKRLSKLN